MDITFCTHINLFLIIQPFSIKLSLLLMSHLSIIWGHLILTFNHHPHSSHRFILRGLCSNTIPYFLYSYARGLRLTMTTILVSVKFYGFLARHVISTEPHGHLRITDICSTFDVLVCCVISSSRVESSNC